MSSPDAPADAPPPAASDPFRPSWLRALATLVLVVGAFFIPQEVPLEYYPLNNPSSGLHYLEITCAASATGRTQIFLDLGDGTNELDSILWPISPTERAYTYTFPLRDAPLRQMRVDPLDVPGELRITNMRIINRRNEEIRRFTRDSFRPGHQIADIPPTDDGWKLVTTSDAHDPYAWIDLDHPIVPEGMNERNLKRCLLSWSYLALMLWIILLAVYFAFLRHRNWRVIGQSVTFLAFMALLFSAVGNRGLIKNSLEAARFELSPYAPGLALEMDLRIARPTRSQLFWNAGRGINEADSAWAVHEPHSGLQTLRFPLPDLQSLHELRFDPSDRDGIVTLLRMRLVDNRRFTVRELPIDGLQAQREIDEIVTDEADHTRIVVSPGAGDPIVMFDPGVVDAVRRGAASAPDG